VHAHAARPALQGGRALAQPGGAAAPVRRMTMASVQEFGLAGISQAPYSRAQLFDAAAYDADPRARRWLLEHFEIIARPGGRLCMPLRRGDVLLRRGEGALAHAAIIVDPEL